MSQRKLMWAVALTMIGVLVITLRGGATRGSESRTTRHDSEPDTVLGDDTARNGAPERDHAPELALPTAAPSAPAVDVSAPAVSVSAPEPEDPAPSAAEQAQLLRMPVISAIRANQPDDEARYRAMRDALARSGPSEEPWTRGANAVFEGWSRALPAGLDVSIDPRSVRCFLAGCQVDVSFADAAGYGAAAAAFREIDEAGASHGGRVQTPAIRRVDGRVQASWMMLRPNVAPGGDTGERP